MRLLVISHTPHYAVDGGFVGWGPTVRELDCLAAEMGPVTHVAPVYDSPPPASALPYESGHVTLRPVRPAGGKGVAAKLDALMAAVSYGREIRQAVRGADLVQVRCPSNIGLVACFVLALSRSPRRWAKYAGSWSAYRGEPLSYRLQRFILARNLMRGPVTINGRWFGQPRHVHSFLNPCLTDQEVGQAQLQTAGKCLERPVRLLFAGRAEEQKGVRRVVAIAAGLAAQGIEISLDIAGDGPDARLAESDAARLGISSSVRFHGWRARPALNELYTRAHFVLLPSRSEGWPKVLSEAMAYRAVPVTSGMRAVRQVLAETDAGVSIPSLDVAQYVAAIERIVRKPDEWSRLADNGQRSSVRFTYHAYIRRLSDVLALSSFSS